MAGVVLASLALLAVAATAAYTQSLAAESNVVTSMELDGHTVTFHAPSYPSGRWKVRVVGHRRAISPGETLDLAVDYALESEELEAMMRQLKEVRLVVAARRVNDHKGRFRSQDGYFFSTYLTPSDLPVEGLQYFIASSHIGGPYKTPLDLQVPVPRGALRHEDGAVRFSARVRHRLARDFPRGLYRLELAFFGRLDKVWQPLHMIPSGGRETTGCDLSYETVFYTKLVLPPVRVGTMATPRAIWTLFSSPPQNGVAGAVAREDAPHFALSTRVKLPVRYTLPCRPGHRTCEYELRPDLPAAKICRYGNCMLEPDRGRGHARFRVRRPDGVVDDLGTHHFGTPWYWPDTTGGFSLRGGPRYRFRQFGKYEITMAGEMYDRFGTRYEAGGTYEVWVAYPLTFATGTKPGTPLIDRLALSGGGHHQPAGSGRRGGDGEVLSGATPPGLAALGAPRASPALRLLSPPTGQGAVALHRGRGVPLRDLRHLSRPAGPRVHGPHEERVCGAACETRADPAGALRQRAAC